MKQQVQRKTLTGAWEAFEFPYKARRFFVKNYSENPVYVSFEDNTDESYSFKIMAGVGEEVAISMVDIQNNPNRKKFSYDTEAKEAFFSDTIYVKGTGEVEVQEVDFDIY